MIIIKYEGIISVVLHIGLLVYFSSYNLTNNLDFINLKNHFQRTILIILVIVLNNRELVKKFWRVI